MPRQKVLMKMNFNEEITKRTEYANQVILKYIVSESGFQKQIAEAMNYSILAGGKRLRPVLLDSFYKLFGGISDIKEPCMAAMEMLHTYSLVHDDLPAIDNDEFRRGFLTTHKKYGEACGILAGDGLLHLAYETFIRAFEYGETDNVIKALRIFGNKTGICGMFGGQSADVLHTGEDISNELMYYIYEKKTGALIEASMMIGAVLAGCDDEELIIVEKIGKLVGLAFQIKDDILDVTGDEKELGKPLNSDIKNNKKTYLSVNGQEKSEEDVLKFSNEASQLLNNIGSDSDERRFLTALIEYLTGRNK